MRTRRGLPQQRVGIYHEPTANTPHHGGPLDTAPQQGIKQEFGASLLLLNTVPQLLTKEIRKKKSKDEDWMRSNWHYLQGTC